MQKKAVSEVKGEMGEEITLASVLKEKYDCVVGNPPYVNLPKKDKVYKNILSHYEDVTSGIVNSSTLFIKRGLDLLTEYGMVGFIVPKSVLRVDSYEPIRRYILDNCEIKSIADVGIPFEEVGYEEVIIILKKQKDKAKRDENRIRIITGIEDLSNKKYKSHKIKQNVFNYIGVFSIYLTYDVLNIVYKINRNCKKLGDISDIFRGLGISKNKPFVLDEKEDRSDEKILRGKGIGRYETKFYLYLDTNHEEVKKYKKAMSRLRHKKIVAQNIVTSKVRVVSTYDEEGCLNIDTITNIMVTDKDFIDKYVLAVINSKLMTFYIRDVVFNKALLTMHLDAPYSGKLPIKKCSKSKQKEFAELADKMLSLNKKLKKLNEKVEKTNKLESEYYNLAKEQENTKNEIEKINDLIDEKVYKLYGLNEKEVKIIGNN
ncbi:MAG: hypothetical protein A7316_10715 [Candidatus Altiarchaeales archaeon WOR_SM1_86-2]|nr:MAG: hypothetical protein A7316_10715 [Candidatus Altiarchaeales archaeon WOR_SM1_86-2]